MSETSVCRQCGRDFAPYRPGVQLYCNTCRNKAAKEATREHRRRCKECGKAFRTRSRAVRYCSDPCRKKGYRSTGPVKYHRMPHGAAAKCRICGKTFKVGMGRGRLRVYCSEKCRDEGTRIRNRMDMRKYLADPEKHAIQRARMRAIRARAHARQISAERAEAEGSGE